MNTSRTPLKTVLAAALGAILLHAGGAGASPQAGAAPAGAPAPAASVPAAVRPGDDFFTYANGDWLARTEIPADRSSWGAFASIAEDTNARIATLIEARAANKRTSGDARKVADF